MRSGLRRTPPFEGAVKGTTHTERFIMGGSAGGADVDGGPICFHRLTDVPAAAEVQQHETRSSGEVHACDNGVRMQCRAVKREGRWSSRRVQGLPAARL